MPRTAAAAPSRSSSRAKGVTQRVVRYMIAEGIRGCVVHTVSIDVTLASDSRPAYRISKAGLGMSMPLFAVTNHRVEDDRAGRMPGLP